MSTTENVIEHPSLGEGLDGLFDEIRPYEPEEMQQAFNDMLDDRQFNVIMKGFVPWLPKSVRNGLLRIAFTGVKTPLDFQKRFMKPVVKYIIRKHTDGCTLDDSSLAKLNQRFTFVSNHRDIVLDSAFLDVLLFEAGFPTTVEIGIGDNLLIYPWIKRLVRMNKAFTVRRGLTPKEMLRSSQLMSSYIHYAVTQKQENIWIAQREGRAKDSDDRTQDAVLKMLAMGGDLSELNIVPLTISYEYDPCDYLKAQEFQQKRDNPAFKKSRQDDLDNMKTGIFGYKGRVHYHCAAPINTWIDELKELPKKEFFAAVAERMDQEIHRHYRLYPCNYIALDMLEGQSSNNNHYTEADRQRFEHYLSGQLAKIDIPNKDDAFLRQCILNMYANPLRNYLREK
ncbi:MAG: 1-acyl-sn-glycerol-3-phosphate acyltransferase [Prevotella sp.]|nr:1-acyl-sn-glycerol-3-phosphate acyltransferase [Prevotella sp.]